MKNLLFISSYPLPLGKGSNQHAYFFLKALALRFNVYCLFFLQPGEGGPFDRHQDLFELGIRNIDLCYFKDYVWRNRWDDVIRNVVAFPSIYMNLATHNDGLNLINKNIYRYDIDIVHIEHMHYLKYALYIRNNIKKVVVYHDLYHAIPWRQIRHEQGYLSKLLLSLYCLKMYLLEKKLESAVHAKVFLNPVEMLAFPRNSVHIPHIVNPEIGYRQPALSEKVRILFLGGYGHGPNRVSARYIVDSIVPRLAGKSDKFRFFIVGTGMERLTEYVEGSSYKRLIEIRGFQRDINEVFRGMDIAFFPILYGGGIKTKIIEAMAAGVPVVTTPEGVVGLNDLPDNCLGVGRTERELVDKVLELMQDHSLRLERSRMAREYVSRFHSFDELVSKVSEFYEGLWR